MKKSKVGWIIGGITVVIIVLLILPNFSERNIELNSRMEELGIDCLPQGHTNLAQHIHPVLEVIVDGVHQTIPANIGITPTCMAELHTHDANGVIHIETIDAGKTFTLGTFLNLWENPYEREGYRTELTIDGASSEMGEDLILIDHQQISLTYIKE